MTVSPLSLLVAAVPVAAATAALAVVAVFVVMMVVVFVVCVWVHRTPTHTLRLAIAHTNQALTHCRSLTPLLVGHRLPPEDDLVGRPGP
eukprot:12341-Eustigmatos_ZCMA.PRE.1